MRVLIVRGDSREREQREQRERSERAEREIRGSSFLVSDQFRESYYYKWFTIKVLHFQAHTPTLIGFDNPNIQTPLFCRIFGSQKR